VKRRRSERARAWGETPEARILPDSASGHGPRQASFDEANDEDRAKRLEKNDMVWGLAEYHGNVSAVTRHFGTSRQRLYRAMDRFGVPWQKEEYEE
jgi:transcriptional regulator of acetoin/glycerol metabolism